MNLILRTIFVTLPLGVAIVFDYELSSRIHMIVLGAVAICVNLSDALFGQVISSTKWIPFSACHTPCEAQALVNKFQIYHSRLFRDWMLAKGCSMVVVMIPAFHTAGLLQNYNAYVKWGIVAGGYVLLGVAAVIALGFIETYSLAIKASDEVKLKEMNYAFKKDHPEYFNHDLKLSSKQLEGFGDGYTSEPLQAETSPDMR